MVLSGSPETTVVASGLVCVPEVQAAIMIARMAGKKNIIFIIFNLSLVEIYFFSGLTISNPTEMILSL